jgi:hypothetical protein
MRRARWLVVLVLLACEDSSASDDPIATTGADVHVTIVGPGRVVSDLPGIDCPGESCFNGLVGAKNGDTRGVTLKAIPAELARFDGWTFDTTSPVGSRGSGPDVCSPVRRPGVEPAIDPRASEIMLPFGSVVGVPPPGTELTCDAYHDVPVAYVATAKFSIVAEDSPFLYRSPDGAGAAHGIAVVRDQLLWQYDDAPNRSQQGSVARGDTSTRGVGIPVVAHVPIDWFQMDRSRGIYRLSNGDPRIWVVQPEGAQYYLGYPGCHGIAVDEPFIFCLSYSPTALESVQAWRLDEPTSGPRELVAGLPRGNELAAGSGFVFIADDTSIRRYDERSLASPPEILFGLSHPSALALAGSRLWFYELDDLGTTVNVVDTNDFQNPARVTPQESLYPSYIVPDSDGTAWIALQRDNGQIFHVVGAGPILCRAAIDGLGGIAVDDAYIYWTQADGAVYRQPKRTCK